MDKKNSALLILIVFITVSLAAMFYIMILHRQDKAAETPVKNWASLSAEIEITLKTIRFLTALDRTGEADPFIHDANLEWAEVAGRYGSVPPAGWEKTQNWKKTIYTANALAREADEAAQEDKPAEAIEKIGNINEIYAVIKKENGIVDHSSEFLSLYLAGQKFLSDTSGAETKNIIADLELQFTGLKELAIDERYEQLMAELETTLLDLGRLLPGPDYEQARNRLEPLLKELYFSY